MALDDQNIFELLIDHSTSVRLLGLDGNIADLKGMLSAIDPPKISIDVEQEIRFGEGGQINRALIFKAMESSLTLKAISPIFHTMVNTAMALKKPITFQISGQGTDRYTSQTGIIRVLMTGIITTLPGFTMKSGEKSELELELGVNKVEDEVGSSHVIFDPGNGIYKVNDVNLWT
jgi:phage tail tube protein FII